MNYSTQIENLKRVQATLSNTEMATRQALNHIVMRLLDDLKLKLANIGLSLDWEEEFSNQLGQLSTEIEMMVTVNHEHTTLAGFVFEPRDASSIAIFIKTFEETMASIISAKSMETKLTMNLKQKVEPIKKKPKI